jgi:glycosyltransferase EpsE
MARISVLIGIYNCASTLTEALDSLYAQTYKDFKIILCDDGSTDDTYAVAKKHADTHGNIVLVRNKQNMGLNYTLNHCLKYADTEYCARMDGDDISLPTRFEKEINFLDTHPEYAIVSCPMIYFDEKGEFGKGSAESVPQKESFIKGSPFCHAPCMIRTEAYKKVGGYSIDIRLLRVEDDHLWFKLYAAGYKGYNLSEPLYMMRDDRNAISRRNWKNRRNEIYVRSIGYRMLKLPWYTQIYALRPLLAYLAPQWIYKIYHRQRLK